MLRVSFIGFFSFLLSFNRVNACGGTGFPSYGGSISYSIDSTNPLKVNFAVTMYFINNEVISNDSVVLNWGDSTQSAIYAISIDSDSLAFANYPLTPQIYRHVYAGSHTYGSVPPGGYYFAWLTNTYRPNGLVNLNDDNSDLLVYTLQAQVYIDTSSGFYFTPPTLQPVDLLICNSGSAFTANPLISVPKYDSISCQLVTPLAVYEVAPLYIPTPAPLLQPYELPSQWCGGSSDSSFVINSSTGAISWPGPVCYDTTDITGEQGFLTYDIAIRVNTYRNGKLIGSIMRDQFIYTIVGPTAITETTAPAGISVYPNPANNKLNIILPGNTTDGQITLYDITGREVLSDRTGNSIQQTMDISALPQGEYLLTFKSSNGLFTQKVVKQ